MAKIKSETLDKYGVPVDVGDLIIYGLRTKHIALVSQVDGKKIRVKHINTDDGEIEKGEGGKTAALVISLTKIPGVFSGVLKNLIAPLRHLTDEQMSSLAVMMDSPDKESANLAYSLIETYKEQSNEQNS